MNFWDAYAARRPNSLGGMYGSMYGGTEATTNRGRTRDSQMAGQDALAHEYQNSVSGAGPDVYKPAQQALMEDPSAAFKSAEEARQKQLAKQAEGDDGGGILSMAMRMYGMG
jgi:hypothetical protein